MTAIDDYLAKERETLRASTPRPWVADESWVQRGTQPNPSGPCLAKCDGGNYPDEPRPFARERNAALIVSAVNDREALLDAVELLAEMTEWLWHARSTPTEPCDEGCEACKDQRRIQSVLSRLTADSEGVGT